VIFILTLIKHATASRDETRLASLDLGKATAGRTPLSETRLAIGVPVKSTVVHVEHSESGRSSARIRQTASWQPQHKRKTSDTVSVMITGGLDTAARFGHLAKQGEAGPESDLGWSL
jgi:hypothetical protein